MTPTVKYGTIVSYTPEKTSGFIRPDIIRPDKKEVYFRNWDSRLPYERTVGDVVLREETSGGSVEGYLMLKDLPPKAGDRVAYYEGAGHPNPKAHRWTWAREWDRSMKMLDDRSNPENPLARAYRIAEDHVTKIVVWEGFFDRLAEAVRTKEPFLQIEGLSFEWRLAHGWKPLEDVRNGYFPTCVPLGEDNNLRSMRMYYALLIERGISILAQDATNMGCNIVLRYAAIGRMRKTKGVHNLWGLENRLPRGNPGILCTCYAVGLITNLDPYFLRVMQGWSYGPDSNYREYAEKRVKDLRSEGFVESFMNCSHAKHDRVAMVAYKLLVKSSSSN